MMPRQAEILFMQGKPLQEQRVLPIVALKREGAPPDSSPLHTTQELAPFQSLQADKALTSLKSGATAFRSFSALPTAVATLRC